MTMNNDLPYEERKRLGEAIIRHSGAEYGYDHDMMCSYCKMDKSLQHNETCDLFKLISALGLTWGRDSDQNITITGTMNNDGWIDVKDRLPLQDLNVLVYTNWGNLVISKTTCDDRWVVNYLGTTTHWQPLQSPPITGDAKGCDHD